MKINIFKHKKPSPMPLRIQGVENAPMTPESDDAEIAAQAILEVMLGKSSKKRVKPIRNKNGHREANDVAYYQHLSKHIREAYHVARQRALRFLCFCEQQLTNPELPIYGHGSVALLETELYKRLDVVEREGGDMKKRWQHCLAEVTLRLMNSQPTGDEKESGDTPKPEKDNV